MNVQKLLKELENPESGVKEYGMSIDDGLYLIKYIRTLEAEHAKMEEKVGIAIVALEKMQHLIEDGIKAGFLDEHHLAIVKNALRLLRAR